MAMAAAMVLMGRKSRSYGCAIQNGEKLEAEFIDIPMVDLPQGTAENCVCSFGGFAWSWGKRAVPNISVALGL